MAGHCSRFAVTPLIAQVMMHGSTGQNLTIEPGASRARHGISLYSNESLAVRGARTARGRSSILLP